MNMRYVDCFANHSKKDEFDAIRLSQFYRYSSEE